MSAEPTMSTAKSSSDVFSAMTPLCAVRRIPYPILQHSLPRDNLIPHVLKAGLNLRDINIFAPSLLALATGLLVLRGCRYGVCHCESGVLSQSCGVVKKFERCGNLSKFPLKRYAKLASLPLGVRHGFQISASKRLLFTHHPAPRSTHDQRSTFLVLSLISCPTIRFYGSFLFIMAQSGYSNPLKKFK
jgi:hypothetical protein